MSTEEHIQPAQVFGDNEKPLQISHCHNAPVLIHLYQQPKYTCSQCGQACIPRKVSS